MPVDLQLQSLLDAMRAAGFPKIGSISAAEMRARPRPPLQVSVQIERVDDVAIPGPAGPLAARVYRPADRTTGLIVYFHGGGWVFGDLDTVDASVRAIVAATRCTALSVDYRLAPEHPFPAAVEDALAAVEWAAAQLQALTGRAGAPLIVMGDSAGGNLAAVCAQHARDAGGPAIALQVLIYPSVEGDGAAKSTGDEPPFMDRGELAWFLDQYIPSSLRGDPRFAPGSVDDLSGLPPAIIVTAEHDLLTEEGLRYGEKLRAAGGEVVSLEYPGAIHGFVSMGATLDIGRKAIDDIAKAIVRSLAAGDATDG